ncbi:OTUD5-like protein [Mya arenaria]|uniref:ubiquitinyl hydrolase 1 n=1 Tax=Mya arenaria TaxID=6604 RepID=A0ABY7FXX5_MYAAR|nr:OTUD5-like protein [Mya arenaria]
MTILPKKKVTKDKNESDNVDKGLSHHPRHHPSGTENRHEKPARVRNSPTRWLPTPGREDAAHVDPGPYDAHDSAAGHNKRRHRSSPHRNHPRKHRGAHSGHASIAPAVAAHSPQQGVSYEEEEPTRNSDDEYLEKWFETSLKEKRGFSIRKMGEDGACLFRAVEDFNTYLNRKRMENCHGNHLEIQAMCEIYNRPIEVYQYSIDPINTFHGSYKTDNEPVRISYHRNVHYNAVIDPYKQTVGVGLGLPLSNFQPGLSEPTLVRDATRQSEELHLEQAMLEDKIRETDWEVTQETLQEQVARSPMSDVAAVGEGAVGGREYETHSIVGQYPESIYADYANFGEEDILAQVIAQSQQEYIDSFKRGAHPPLPGADKGSPRAPGRPDSPPS